jgi:cytochrome c biogenesis protein CcmG, thiol:disulfide interchange protein DsbE
MDIILSCEMKNKTLPFVLIGSGLILVGITAWYLIYFSAAPEKTQARACAPVAEVHYQAPELSLVDLSLSAKSLKDYSDQVVLVNTWATWCPPCREEMPALEAFYQAHKDEGFTLTGINIGESQQIVEKFVSDSGISFPVWLDPHEESLKAFNTFSLPSSFVIDREGTVIFAWSGAICLDQLEESITPIIRQ